MWAELPEPIHLETGQSICYVIVDPSDVLDVDMNVVLPREKSEGTDQGHHGLATGGGLGHNVDH